MNGGDMVQQAADVIASATGNGFTSSTVGSHIIAEALAAAGLLVDPADGDADGRELVIRPEAPS